MKKLLTIFLLLFFVRSFSQTTPLSFTRLTADSTNWNRGAQHWGQTEWDNLIAPRIPTYTKGPKNYYSRFNWLDIESNTIQGSYSWTVFDAFVNKAIDSGAMFTFGLMPICDACGAGGLIPSYVQTLMTNEGKPGPTVLGTVYPNYQSTNWKARYIALMKAVANHIATTSRSGKPFTKAFLGYDIRHYGNFGEGVGYSSVNPPGIQIPTTAQVTTAYMTSMIDSAISIFPNVQLTIPMNYVAPNNDYTLTHGNPDAQSAYYALTRANNYGLLGWRRDNIGDDGYNSYFTTTATFNGVSLQTLLLNCYKGAPIGGEPANDNPGVSRCGQPYCDVHNENTLFHMSYFGNGNYPNSSFTNPTLWAQQNANMTAASAEMGYKVGIDTGKMTTTILSGNPFNITLNWHNIGLAPVYEHWRINFQLRNSSTGVVVWSGISRLNLKLFQPSATATVFSDNFSMNNSIPAATYSMYIIVTDTSGYKTPFSLNMTGRQSDGSYLLRSGISITSTPLTDSLTLAKIWGESNAAGNADNSGAPASEVGLRTEVKILQHTTLTFASLNIGVNNYQDNFIVPNPQTKHGLELSMANEVDSGHLPNPMYLVKIGVSGAYICQWFPGAEGNACRPGLGSLWDNEMPFVDAAISQINLLGKPYRIVVWGSIGLNDELNQNTPVDTFANRMQKYRTLFRNHLSRSDVVFLGTNFNNPPGPNLPPGQGLGLPPAWDSVYRIVMPGMDSKYHTTPVIGATYVDAVSHYDYNGFKIIGKNMVDTMLSLQGLPSGGGSHGPPTAVISQASPIVITLPTNSVTLTGTGSFAQSPAHVVAYQWSTVSGPNTPTITTPTASSTNFTGLIQGNYVLGLQVTDDSTLTGSATVAVTVNPVPGAGVSIFTTQTPASDTQNEGNALELGMKFRSTVAGFITGVKFYKTLGNTGTHIGELYSSTGTRLAAATYTGETASGWQTVTFSTPIAILANTTYITAYFSPSGTFVSDGGTMTSPVVNAPLTALANGTDGPNGVFLDTAVPAFPNDNCCIANYWVDVLFSQVFPNPCNCHIRNITGNNKIISH